MNRNKSLMLIVLAAAVSVAIVYASGRFVPALSLSKAFTTLIHEAGHVLAVLGFGLGIQEIDIHSRGGHTLFYGESLHGWKAALIAMSGFLFSWLICLSTLLLCAAHKSNATLAMAMFTAITFLVAFFANPDIVVNVTLFGFALLFITIFVINALKYFILHVLAFSLLAEIFHNDIAYVWMGKASADAFKAAQYLDIHYTIFAILVTVVVLLGLLCVIKIWLNIGFYDFSPTDTQLNKNNSVNATRTPSGTNI